MEENISNNGNKKEITLTTLVIDMGCYLLIYFCFLVVVLLMSNSMSRVLYITVFKNLIFNLSLDLEL